MKRATASLTVAILLTVPAFGQADKPQEIVKRAIEAHGGEKVLKSFPAGTSKMKGTLTMEGQEMPFTGTLAFAVPGKVHLELAIQIGPMGPNVTVSQIINGDKVVQKQNGRASKLTDVMREELRRSPAIQEMSLLTPLLNEKVYTLESGKDEDVDGKPAHAVIVKAKGMKDITLWFDAKAGLLVKMKRKALNPEQMEVTEESTFSDFQKASGMIVPLKLAVAHNGKPFMSVTVSDYKPLEKIDDKEFTVED